MEGKKEGQKEWTTWNKTKITSFEADGSIVLCENAEQNSLRPILLASLCPNLNTEAQSQAKIIPYLKHLTNQIKSTEYQRPVTLLADASLLFSFPQDFNYLLIAPGKSAS